MTNRTYPYKAWVLQPAFKPIEVEFVEGYRTFGNEDYGDYSSTKKLFRRDEIHASKADAIAHGWSEVERIQADLDKRNENLRKKRAALNKAAGKELT